MYAWSPSYNNGENYTDYLSTWGWCLLMFIFRKRTRRVFFMVTWPLFINFLLKHRIGFIKSDQQIKNISFKITIWNRFKPVLFQQGYILKKNHFLQVHLTCTFGSVMRVSYVHCPLIYRIWCSCFWQYYKIKAYFEKVFLNFFLYTWCNVLCQKLCVPKFQYLLPT